MSLRRLSRNAFAAIAQVVVCAGLQFELYRFLLHHLGPKQIGVWSLVLASTALARLGEFGLGGGVTKFVAGDLGDRHGERAAATVGMSVVAMGAVIGVVCLVLQPVLHAGLAHLITDPPLLEAASKLLPWALASLWLNSMSQVFLSAIDACQRNDLNTATSVGAAAGQLCAAYLIVPHYGLIGLGPVQFAQAGLTIVLAIGLLTATLRYPMSAWFTWERKRFVEILRYGGRVQLAALPLLTFDPTVKALLSVFGGLGLTGYYEMANRAVIQFRAIIVTACQRLVPFLANRAGNREPARAQIVSAYRKAHSLLFVLVIPYFALVAAALPWILTFWLGRFETNFVHMGLVAVTGWTLNTLAIVPYVIYLAIGKLRWMILANLLIGILNVIFASFGGWLFGGFGVVIGAMAALAIGSMVNMLTFHLEFDLSWREWVPSGSAPLVAASLIGAAVMVTAQLHAGPEVHRSTELLPVLAGFALVCSVLVWRHPIFVEVLQHLRAAPITDPHHCKI